MTNILSDALNAFLKKIPCFIMLFCELDNYEVYIFLYNEDFLNINSKVGGKKQTK